MHQKIKHTFLKDYTSPQYLIESIELQFTLDPKETLVNSKLYIKRNQKVFTSNKSITLDGINLNLQIIKLNSQILNNAAYKITSEHLIIAQVPDNFILETLVKINPEKNLSCTGLYLSDDNFCTQNEPCGFRHLTYFIDRPDILTKFTVTIIADKTNYPVLLSNGNLTHTSILPNNMHSATWQDPFPKSAYLFALVAGKFSWIEDHYITNSEKKIILRIFAEQKLLEQCHHAMHSLKQAMAWEEKNFNLEYDLDIYQIVAINDFNAGAMENKSLNIFNSELLLASQNTSTDDDFNRVSAVIAHEYFHNWTGNRVTCRDWFQIGLKEGLTTLREQLFMEDTYGQAINRINSIKTIRTKQFAEDSGPLSHPIRLQSYIEINNFYTFTVYYKSAEVARMLSTIFGREILQQIIKNFLQKYDGQAVTIEDFLQTASLVTKTNLDQFKLWYIQAGTPKLNINSNFINKIFTLKIKQERQYEKQEDFCIPLEIALINSDGNNTHAKTLIINKGEQDFSFSSFNNKPVPSLLRNFSAPVKIEYSYSDNALLLSMCNDQDYINAWDASQKLLTSTILRVYNNFSASPKEIPEILIRAFKIIINNNKIDPQFAAQLLKLPTENYLFEILPKINIKAMHYASEFVKLELAKNLKSDLLECYKNNNEPSKPYSLDAISIGKRSLKNLCLYYLMHLNTIDIHNICLEQLEHANNMTDVYASLSAIANSNYLQWEQVLNNYYNKWQGEQNLINKWLALNATIKLPGILQRIQDLMSYPIFNITNPNKVYALIRTFCENNHINFHEEQGDGYKFLADQVLIIDKFNPQLAATIALPLTRGHKLNEVHQQLMQMQLTRITQESGLSKNVYEILSKTTCSQI